MSRAKLSASGLLAFIGICVGCAAPEGPPVEEAADVAGGEAVVALEEVVDLPNAAAQIAAAVMAAPPDLREAVAVRAWAPDGAVVLLRRGTNGVTCLADDPSDERFQVACYHDSLEAYMARGRALRAEGVSGPDNLDRRHQEIDAGLLEMPTAPTAVYTLGGEAAAWNPETGEVDETRTSRVYAVYVAGATEASTGLSTTPPSPGGPWIMRPGTPSSHVMVVPPRPAEEADGEE